MKPDSLCILRVFACGAICASLLTLFSVRPFAAAARLPAWTLPAGAPPSRGWPVPSVIQKKPRQEPETALWSESEVESLAEEEYPELREAHLARVRGIHTGAAVQRVAALRALAQQEQQLRRSAAQPSQVWQPLGPSPIPPDPDFPNLTAISGRVSALAIHPAHPDLVYAGTAQGGVYRTLDGGQTWTPLLDNALSLSVGSLALAPSDPATLYVGTGEAVFSLDSFFGVGLYRIRQADTNPVVEGPFNLDPGGADVFTGRSLSKILVSPADPNTIFVASANGSSGFHGGGGRPPDATAQAGLYRCTNALSAAPVFVKLAVSQALNGNRPVTDAVLSPANPNHLLAHIRGNATPGDGGIYLSENALAATPTFRQTYVTNTTANARGELAAHQAGDTLTVVAALADNGGRVIKSNDGGRTWSAPLPAANGFCGAQCFYNIAVALAPNDAGTIYLGGQASNREFQKSVDGGQTFASRVSGLHVDTHALAVAPSNPQVIYLGSDGGIWRSVDGGENWVSLNTATFSATQFYSLALHPTDRNFSIGGTQDVGGLFYRPDGQWVQTISGDGGHSVIDQNATGTTAVTAYHTDYNRTQSLIGFHRTTAFNVNSHRQESIFLGCLNGVSNNGIACSDPVLFYAPLTRGPGNPNTLYFGTNRLYRSADQGATMNIASQDPLPDVISAIAVAPQDDNMRVVGLISGQVFATTNGSATLREITGPWPAFTFISRLALDPRNSQRAFLTLTNYGLDKGQHIWQTQNLSAAQPTWTPAGWGVPDVPVNALTFDPAQPGQLFAGTDIGVYRSTDDGATWQPCNDGLPRVAVFDLAVHPAFRLLRAATHGRGVYETALAGPGATPTPTPAPSLVQFSAAHYAVAEGDGVATLTVTRAGDTAQPATVEYAAALDESYVACGALAARASSRCDYTVTSGVLSFAAGVTSRTFTLPLIDDLYQESSETVAITLSQPAGALLGPQSEATLTIADNDAATSTIRFLVAQLNGANQVPANSSAATGQGIVTLNENATQATVSLNMTGLTGPPSMAGLHCPASVTATGPLVFPLGAGPVSGLTFNLTPTQARQLRLGLCYFNIPTSGFPSGEIRGQIMAQPLEHPRFFVRQHYADFLSRVADAGGLAYWTGQIADVCGVDLACLSQRRVAVSNAFFFELEFQQTGAYVYRLYRAAYGNNQPSPAPEVAHLPGYTAFARDRARVVGGANLAAGQVSLAQAFTQRPEFLARYPASLTAAQFVDALLGNLQTAAGVDLSAQRTALIGLADNEGRSAVLYRLADDNAANPINNRAFLDAEYNRAFVLTQYYGYLQRDADAGGYDFWLGVVNRFPLRSVTGQNAMVCAFITSQEYQERFSVGVTRSNHECPPAP